MANRLRRLPSVAELLQALEGRELCSRFGEGITKTLLRQELDHRRRLIRQGRLDTDVDAASITRSLQQRLERLTSSGGRRTINATGILLHTNLGRSPLCPEAVEAMQAVAGYTPLEIDLESGNRGRRGEVAGSLLQALTGCESTLVVNNNAAATLLILNSLGQDREIVISRGQLIEIGGSFRLPEVMEQSGARLREVGTTNRTYLRDYEQVIHEGTAALLYVHPSNYQINGFVASPDVQGLARLAHQYQLPLIADLGSGALVGMEEFGFPNEPTVPQALADGADIVCFSGDKLLGGPQCGIVCGREAIVGPMRQNPFTRMFRVDKLTLAALEATLIHFINDTFREAIPFFRMLRRSVEELEKQANRIVAALPSDPRYQYRVDDDASFVGSGSVPEQRVPTKVLRLTSARGRRSDSMAPLSRHLREQTPSLIGRIQDETLVLDMRTIEPDQVAETIALLSKALGQQEPKAPAPSQPRRSP